MLKIEIRNAGEREKVHPRFRKRIAAICLDTLDDPEWLKIGEGDISLVFAGDETVRSGPVDISVHLPGELPKPESAKINLLARAICTIVFGFYSENGYPRRQIRTTVFAENDGGGEPLLKAVWSDG